MPAPTSPGDHQPPVTPTPGIIVEKQSLRAAELHHHGRRHDHAGAGRLGELRQAERGQGQRHPGHPLLQRQLACRRQVPAGRPGPGLLGRDHRPGQAARHRPLLHPQLRHAGEPERQGPEHGHHRPGEHRSRHRQALRHELPGRDHPRLRQRAKSAARQPRHPRAARGRGCFHGRLAGARVGQRLPGPGRARGRGDRRGGGERLPDRLAEPVGGTDQARSGLERRRLSRPGGTGPRPDRGAQARDAPGEPLGLDRPDVRPRLGGGGEGPGHRHGPPVRGRGLARPDGGRPCLLCATPTTSSTWSRPTSCS